MPKRRSKKSAKVAPTGESPRSSRRRQRMPRHAPSARMQAQTRLVLLEACRENLHECQTELAALREENTILRQRLEHFAPGTGRHGSPHGGRRRTYRRRRRRRRRRSRRSVPS